MHLNLTKRLFWLIALVIISIASLFSFYQYTKTLRVVEGKAKAKAQSLEEYFVSMRYVYHQQFVDSGIDLKDNTVGFLPAHASAFISDEFAKRSHEGITIRNVTDVPRNESNRADKVELEAIEYFKKHKDVRDIFKQVNSKDGNYFFYAKPLVIEGYCLQCHGKKEEVLPYIAQHYNTAFDYKVGDIRGVTSIKIPTKTVFDEVEDNFIPEVLVFNSFVLVLLAIIYYIIRRFLRKDAEYKERLELEVIEQTAELEKTTNELLVSNEKQKRLYSTLRTIADSNQILLSAQSLDELLEEIASSLVANPVFASVKILIFNGEKLVLKVIKGVKKASEISMVEQMAFDQNTPILIDDFNTPLASSMPQECKEFIILNHITSIYVTPLKIDIHSKFPIGIISLCTSFSGGFSKEERAMIDKLSNDLGFAINAFYQKDNMLRLSYYDTLTDLPNRRMFLEKMNSAILESSHNTHFNALMFIDLDKFKTVNDEMGHLVGDEILRETAKRLKGCVRQNDTVARYGGDEFVMLLENVGLTSDIATVASTRVANKVLEVSREPFCVESRCFELSASIGITLFNSDKFSIDTLITKADEAMYESKNSGRNTYTFSK